MSGKITVKNLVKSFGPYELLNVPLLEVSEGSVCAVIGKSGAGKSLLLKVLSGLADPTSGEVKIEKEDGSSVKIGSMVEEPGFMMQFSAKDNMELKRRMLGIKDPNTVDELLSLTGLAGQGKKKVKLYTRDMMKRLGIAMALLGDPDVLILDEPTAGMDANNRQIMNAFLVDLNKNHGTTIVISGEDVSEFSQFPAVFCRMEDGHLSQRTTTGDIKESSVGRIELVLEPISVARKVLEEMEIYSYQTKSENHLWVLEQINRSAEIVRKMRERGVVVSSVEVVHEGYDPYL